jgi:putative flippase GtrA
LSSIFHAIVNKFKNLFNNRQIARFAVVGVLNTAFGWTIFPILYLLLKPLKAHYLVVLTLSYVTSIIFAYGTNKIIVFRSEARGVTEFLRFASFYLIYFAVNLVVLPFGVEVLHINPVYVQCAMVVAIAMSSYFWHLAVTFKQRTPARSEPDIPM